MSGVLLAIPFGAVFLLLVTWSLFIFHHLRAYAIRGDRANATMTSIFIAGCLAFTLLSLIAFLRVPWASVAFSLPEGLSERALEFLQRSKK